MHLLQMERWTGSAPSEDRRMDIGEREEATAVLCLIIGVSTDIIIVASYIGL